MYLQFCGRSKTESECGVIEVEPGEIIGCKGEGGRPVRKLSAFDYFTGMTGKGCARAAVLYNVNQFRVDVYNREEEQIFFTAAATRMRSGFNCAVIR